MDYLLNTIMLYNLFRTKKSGADGMHSIEPRMPDYGCGTASKNRSRLLAGLFYDQLQRSGFLPSRPKAVFKAL